MSKEDTANGLLSKMVKFVRNPTTNWADLDNQQSDRQDSISKQLLREMVERKRRNDFVRKREFDMLRKMRKREAVVGGQDGGSRPSFFQSSLASRPDDRATTLKKIDEIEAQMSMQWWKKNQGSQADSSLMDALGVQPPPVAQPARAQGLTGGAVQLSEPTAPASINRLGSAYRPTVPATLQSRQQAAEALASGNEQPHEVPEKNGQALSSPSVNQPTARPDPAPAGLAARRQPAVPAPANGSTDQYGSKFAAVDDGAAQIHDAELEEAAIRFANGDDSGAEAGLLELLAAGGTRAQHPATWLTLFDLYRATAQQDKFETAAIQFVERFNRSAPQWFSMPDMFKLAAQPPGKPGANGNGPAVDWVCPSVVGIQTVAAVKAALGKAAMPWRLDWRNLKSIDAAAVFPLLRVFNGWASTNAQLRFIGDAQLQQVLLAATPSGERSTEQSRWQLRMEALRVTNRPDDFEMAALDFCVTYEVSPPSWEKARCHYRPIDGQGSPVSADSSLNGQGERDSYQTSVMIDGESLLSQMDSTHSHPGGGVQVVDLSGEIQGDAIALLDKLDSHASRAEALQICCTKLIRVDFSAAGTLLNWVTARQSENRPVHFSDVNRLVAPFFHVIGITEHSRVVIRVD